MRPFDQVDYPLDPLSHRRASADPLAMVGASRMSEIRTSISLFSLWVMRTERWR